MKKIIDYYLVGSNISKFNKCTVVLVYANNIFSTGLKTLIVYIQKN